MQNHGTLHLQIFVRHQRSKTVYDVNRKVLCKETFFDFFVGAS